MSVIQSRDSVRLMIAAVLAIGLLSAAASLARGEDQPAGRGVSVIASDATGLSIETSAPEFTASDATGPDGTGYVRLAIPGFASGEISDPAGVPDLPRQSFLLAVPPGAELGLHIEVLAERSVQLGAAVYPVAALAADGPVDPVTGGGGSSRGDRRTRGVCAGCRGVCRPDPLSGSAGGAGRGGLSA